MEDIDADQLPDFLGGTIEGWFDDIEVGGDDEEAEEFKSNDDNE